MEAFEAALGDAIDEALTEVGFTDAVRWRREEAAVVERDVRDALSDFVARQGSAAAFDVVKVASECAWKRENERRRAVNKDRPDPVVGWSALLAKVVVAGNQVVALADEVGRNWDLTEEDFRSHGTSSFRFCYGGGRVEYGF